MHPAGGGREKLIHDAVLFDRIHTHRDKGKSQGKYEPLTLSENGLPQQEGDSNALDRYDDQDNVGDQKRDIHDQRGVVGPYNGYSQQERC